MNESDRSTVATSLLEANSPLTLIPSNVSHVEDITEKRAILMELLQRDPALFLERYGKLLPSSALSKFACSNDYEVRFHINALMPQNSAKLEAAGVRQIKNRRFTYLQHLLNDTDYFSEVSMASREPELFESYVGRYEARKLGSIISSSASSSRSISAPNATAPAAGALHAGMGAATVANRLSGMKLSDLVLKKYDFNRAHNKKRQQFSDTPLHPVRPVSCDQWVAEDVADLDGGVEECLDDDSHERVQEILQNADGADELVSAADQELLSTEFLQVMKERFLLGFSQDIDYDTIDRDNSLDNFDAQEMDAQDKYFDGD